MKESIVPLEVIESRIFLIRGQKVMLGMHLAELYKVETRVLNQAVKRNRKRFPEDFVFQLNKMEADWLVSQNVIPHKKYFGGTLPYAFTEQGVAMLSSVLNSDRAVLVNIAIMRTFVKLRDMIAAHKELAHKLAELERKLQSHDAQIQSIFKAIHQLMQPLDESSRRPEKPKRQIGFHVEEPKSSYRVRRKR